MFVVAQAAVAAVHVAAAVLVAAGAHAAAMALLQLLAGSLLQHC